MKKQHLKPMVKVSSHLCLSDIIRSNLLGLGWEARGGGKTRQRQGFSSFLIQSRCLGFQLKNTMSHVTCSC